MNVSNRDVAILEKVIEYAQRIANNVIRFGDDFDIFSKDIAYFDACNMCIMQIGELANHLSDEFKFQNRHIPWRDVISTRNIAAHTYERFDNVLIWETIKEDIPNLQAFCIEILEENHKIPLEDDINVEDFDIEL